METHSTSSVQVGSQLGPFRITGRLGAGGAGNVFSAENIETGEPFALKVLRPEAEEVEEIHARFIREITVAQKLNDPHIVSYHDCDVENGILYYAMEYVSWGSLASVLQSRHALPWRDACECGVQIANALQHMHELGIVHRDLKPGNIFLSEDGYLKLGDFGLARDFESSKLTADGITVGTVKYMSPEQAKGFDDIDPRADLYALGCNLFEYIVGHTPFDQPGGQPHVPLMEMLRRHIEVTPHSLRDLAPQCPPELADLVASLLAKDPDQRPKSAKVVSETLTRILEGETGAVTDDQTEEQPALLTERLRAPVANDQISPRRLIAVVAAVILLIVALVVIGPRL